MKFTKFLLALVFFCSLLTACTNDQYEEEEALFNLEDIQGTDEDPTPPIDDPIDGDD